MSKGFSAKQIYEISALVIMVVIVVSMFLLWGSKGMIVAENFTEDYCLDLLASNFPEANTTALVSTPFANGTINVANIYRDNNESATISVYYARANAYQPSMCSLKSLTYSGLSFVWSGSYVCDNLIYRYRIEENNNWLGLAVQVEMPNEISYNNTPIFNMSDYNVPRFNDFVGYYNPSDPEGRAIWENQSNLVKNRLCI